MNADDFVKEMAKYAPDKQKLIGKGYPLGAIEAEMRSFIIPPRKGRHEKSHNPIVDLLGRYDTSRFIHGNISFNVAIKEDKDLTKYFATLDGFYLRINSKGEIEKVEHEDFSIFTVISSSASNFLAALIIYAEYLYLRENDIPYNRSELIKKASSLSEGGEYFFSTIIL